MGNTVKHTPRRTKGRPTPMAAAINARDLAALALRYGVEQSAKTRRLLREGDAILARVEKSPTAKGTSDLLADAVDLYHEAMAHGRRLEHGMKKFPALQRQSVLPSNGICPGCKKKKVMRGRSTVIVMGGAMRVVDAKTGSAEIAEDCVGFLDLHWHGGEGDVDVHLPIADETPNGQFEFYFCSIYCLRVFFSACVDELSVRIEIEQIQRARKARRLAAAAGRK